MSFDKAGEFLLLAAQKHDLHEQTLAGILLERVRQKISSEYEAYAPFWIPTKFEDKKLFIETLNASASSALFMQTNALLEKFKEEKVLNLIEQIVIKKRKN